MTRHDPRCKHGIEFPELACGICRGEVTRENQTREYGGGPAGGSIGMRSYLSSSRKLPADSVEVIDDGAPRHSRRAPTAEEMRETVEEPRFLPVHPDEEEEEAMSDGDKPGCPRCHGETTAVLRNGNPGVCAKCRNKAVSKAMQARINKSRLVEPKPENIAELDTKEPLKEKEAEIDLDGVKELVDAHWKYVKGVLQVHRTPPEIVSQIEYHYRTAMLHGYKHGADASTEQRIKG